MIHTRQLTKTFRRKDEVVEAVKGIDIDIADGEMVAVLGPNGAGKSTTLRMLTSLLHPTSGTAQVAGFDVVEHPAQVRAHIGYIGQGTGGGHSHRVLDELHNQGRFYHLPKSEYTARARNLLDALELHGVDKRTVESLSGGQKRRLDVAMGLMNRPRLLFLDEPTTGLDPHARANLWQHIMSMRQQYGMTMVLTTHYLDEADSMSERVVIIDHGSVIADSTAAQLKRDYADDIITVLLPPEQSASAAMDAVRPVANFSSLAIHPDSTGSALVLALEHGAEALPPVLYALKSAGFAPTAAELRQASLDDVFLNLTGRSLREEAA